MQGLDSLPGRIVVCAPAEFPALIPGDIFGTCAVCGRRVRFRPHVPAVRSLVCLLCYFVHAEPGDACELTPESCNELAVLGMGPNVPKC
jgi:hypothetical protein